MPDSTLAGAVFALLLSPMILSLMPAIMGCHPTTPNALSGLRSSPAKYSYAPSKPAQCSVDKRKSRIDRARRGSLMSFEQRSLLPRERLGLLPSAISGLRFSECVVTVRSSKCYFFSDSRASAVKLVRLLGRPPLLRFTNRSRSLMPGDGPLPVYFPVSIHHDAGILKQSTDANTRR